MNYEKVIMAVAVLTFIFSAGLSGVQAKSLDSDPDTEQRTELILESFESSDYDRWQKLVNPNSNLARSINEDNFSSFIEARKLARQGKYEEFLQSYENLKENLGLSDEDVEKVAAFLDELDKEK